MEPDLYRSQYTCQQDEHSFVKFTTICGQWERSFFCQNSQIIQTILKYIASTNLKGGKTCNGPNFGKFWVSSPPYVLNVVCRFLFIPKDDPSYIQLDWTFSARTRKINFRTNQKGYDKSKTTNRKLSAKENTNMLCLHIFVWSILTAFQNNVPNTTGLAIDCRLGLC